MRSDWIDYRASLARIARREDAGEQLIEVCPSCGTEADVSDVVHSPRCVPPPRRVNGVGTQPREPHAVPWTAGDGL